jgi:hypothetical protein
MIEVSSSDSACCHIRLRTFNTYDLILTKIAGVALFTGQSSPPEALGNCITLRNELNLIQNGMIVVSFT